MTEESVDKVLNIAGRYISRFHPKTDEELYEMCLYVVNMYNNRVWHRFGEGKKPMMYVDILAQSRDGRLYHLVKRKVIPINTLKLVRWTYIEDILNEDE